MCYEMATIRSRSYFFQAFSGDQIGRPYAVLEEVAGIYWRGRYGFFAAEAQRVVFRATRLVA